VSRNECHPHHTDPIDIQRQLHDGPCMGSNFHQHAPLQIRLFDCVGRLTTPKSGEQGRTICLAKKCPPRNSAPDSQWGPL